MVQRFGGRRGMRRGWLLGAALLPVTAALVLSATPAAAQLATSATVSVSPTVVTYGTSVTYTMTVTAGLTGVTSGTVTFVWGNTFLCGTNTPGSGGTFTCNSTNAPGGVDTITGIYVDGGTYDNTSATTGSDPNNCGSSGQPTCPLTVNVTPPNAPAGATKSASNAGTDHSGAFNTTSGQLTVQANGAGAVTAANYGSNPTSSTPVGATGTYDDVAIGTGSSFSSLIIAVCDYGSARSLQWYDTATSSWVEFSAQSRTIACLFAQVTGVTSPSLTQLVGTPIAASVLTPPSAPQGYWLVARDGGIFSYNRPFFGSTGSIVLNKPIVGMATTNDEKGYWMAGADGGIFAFGDAPYVGSLPARHINVSNIVALVSDPSTDGYYIIGSDGSVWNFNAPQVGDLPFFGIHVNNIVGAALTPSDKGMYLAGADGKVYVLLGDGHFQGDASSIPLNAPIVGMSVDPVTGGYWLLGKDGGVFSYGAPFYGSTGALRLNQPVIAMAATGDGGGYWFTALDGGVFSYGDAQFWGSTGAIHLNQPVIGMSGS
jgi:hypothetical protein